MNRTCKFVITFATSRNPLQEMSKPSSKLSAALGKLLSLLFLVSTMVDFTEAFDWQPGSNGQVMWAMNCDFSGNDFDHVTSIGDVCGDLCVANEQCTHFTWANGICNLKAFINDAIATDLNGAVCGWVDHRGAVQLKNFYLKCSLTTNFIAIAPIK